VQLEVIRVNVLGMLNLADLCEQRKIHLTTYATGCIFHYDKDFPQGSGKGFKEEDTPNFAGSYYSKTKVWLDCMLYRPSFSNLMKSHLQSLSPSRLHQLHAPFCLSGADLLSFDTAALFRLWWRTC